ncbi:hypothetical protein [Salinarimonas soli]|uniref:Uncharacterized protein n=1 Tax=Salinarimonas soli TaxID=1638099 RepID=A0A5B2W1E1_9HYPH|nr:hypothetical protein [Salinarimonas soli]KAA2244277.1 hypothetical protein F0L46_01125 [Salinarimonas soli]
MWFEARRWAYRLTGRMGLPAWSREATELVSLILFVAKRIPTVPGRTIRARERVLLAALDIAQSEAARDALARRLGVSAEEARMFQDDLLRARAALAYRTRPG